MTYFNQNTFDEDIANKTVVVDFYAEWCGPCSMLDPIMREISEANPHIVVGKVNIDANPDITTRFKIGSVPTIIFLNNSREVGRFVGLASKTAIQTTIDRLTKTGA